MSWDTSYEDLVGTPEEILEDSRDIRTVKWRRLRAFCLYGLHDDAFGPFTRMDDYLELPNGRGTSPESWGRLARHRHLKGLVWRCESCGRDTQHVPKGFTWA